MFAPKFTLFVAMHYLTPRKKHLSITLIAFASVLVISLVVWLLLIFLSVTEGIENNWIKKLTDLHAPIRITPTEEYYASYYYRIDNLCNSSLFQNKTLGAKLVSSKSDPYEPEEDGELPSSFPKPQIDDQGHLVDPVKTLVQVLQRKEGLLFQDYEMSGATLKLHLLRKPSWEGGQSSLHFLTQVAYLATPPKYPSILTPLLLPPTAQDIDNLFFLADYSFQDSLADQGPVVLSEKKTHHQLLQNIVPHTAEVSSFPASFLEEGVSFLARAEFIGPHLSSLYLDETPLSNKQSVHLVRQGEDLLIQTKDSLLHLPAHYIINLPHPLKVQVHVITSKPLDGKLQDLPLHVEGTVQSHCIKGTLPWHQVKLSGFSLRHDSPLPWTYQESPLSMHFPSTPHGEGILLPKSFQDHQVLLGDRGFLSYHASTATSFSEHRIPVFVAGFYDPGLISIGGKCLLVSKHITETINAANTTYTFDKVALNGFQVWCKDPAEARALQIEIQSDLQEAGIANYWKVTSFHEYDHAKDLLQQFQSDRYLFSLIGILILIVACCNIFSFLLLLVQDKKKEIAILQAMGASKRHIATIFGTCGVVIGCLGSLLGACAAMITLHHIDFVVQCLSALQGHEAFHQAFYGSSLPSTLSHNSLLLLLVMTPTLSLLAGLLPAIKACKLHPSPTLRSET
ncbi:MAG: FtsX-like permease family protein [Chlamydiae bacterium]|nr:FtsX-like permease family protein [Chlamydiota bacterium]